MYMYMHICAELCKSIYLRRNGISYLLKFCYLRMYLQRMKRCDLEPEAMFLKH